MNIKRKSDISKLYYIAIYKGIRLHIGAIMLFISSIIFRYTELFLIAYTSAFLHELGHVLCAKKLDIQIRYIQIEPFGMMAKISDTYIKEPLKELIISITGPVVSLCIAIISIILNYIFNHELLEYSIYVNSGLFLINLIPCLPLDGGRIIKSILTERYGIITAYNFMTKSSKGILIIMFCISSGLILTMNFNFSFILILAFLMGNITAEYKTINIITMKEIIYNKDKLYSNNLNRVKNATAFYNVNARVLLRNLSYNYFYIINVIDDNQCIIGTLTETQVIDGILKHGICVTLGELL